jgi:hypothetical protein
LLAGIRGRRRSGRRLEAWREAHPGPGHLQDRETPGR